MADVSKKAGTLFYSYAPSPKDEVLREELEKHLVGLQRKGLIESWSRREIVAGKSQQEEIDKHLEAASVILLLISPDFLASDYYYGAEMMRAMERHHAGDAHVIPILLRPVYLEDEPFTHLASLPTNGKPISMWRNRDAAFAEVAKEISKVIRELPVSSVSLTSVRQNPFRFANNVLNYFTHIPTFLDTEGRWFQHDYEQGRIYIPEKEYFARIEKVLNTKRRVLLLGRAASGKTTLAIALAKHLQEQAGYSVGYKDARQAEIGDGRTWYALAREHDQPNILYILDNCHLATREVDEFCRQWKEQPPAHAQCLLLSRTNLQEVRTEESSYLQMFTDDEKIHIHSEDIFLQVIEQYITTLHQEASAYDAVLKNDDSIMLEKQHAHNLIISRSRLDVWRTLGPQYRLSEVRQEDLYRAIATKYLSVYGTALATLSVLQRYEIRAHTFFVEKELPQDEIKQLQKEKLLVRSTVTGYGQMYDLVLHPTEARELFFAHVFNQYGTVTQENINQLVIATLETYLRAKPSNYVTVYDSLARQRHEDILKHLLANSALQESTAEQFSKETTIDAIRYVSKVAKLDSERGAYLMNKIVYISGIQGICAKLLKASFQDIAVLLQAIKSVDGELAYNVADALNVQQLSQQMVEENIQSLFRLLRALQTIASSQAELLLTSIPVTALMAKTTVRNLQDMVKQLQTYGYSHPQLQYFVESLDIQQFAQQCDTISLQSLFWALYTLEKISPRQAQTLLKLLPAWMLSMKASVSNLGSIDQIVQLMQRLRYTSDQMLEFVEVLDMEQVAQRARQGNLRRLASLLRSLKTISKNSAARLLEALDSADIAQLCRTQETSLADLEQLRKASTRAFWESFLHHCSPSVIAELFQRTPLGTIGTFLLYQYASSTIQEGYTLFQKQFLRERLSTEPLDEIGAFLDRIAGIRQQGQVLARNALHLLGTTDIAERVAYADLRQFALLLHHARTIDATQLPLLLAPLRQTAVLQNALVVSGIYSIQLLIFNVASIDVTYVQFIRQGLRTLDIAEKLEHAPIKDIGLFLWNVYRYVDEDIARKYCEYIDTHYQTLQLRDAVPEDLCFFLWNYTSISTHAELQLFRDPSIRQLLMEGWPSETGWSMVLLGIAAMAHVSSSEGENPPSIPIREDALAHWFATNGGGRNPYFVALALRGLQSYEKQTAHTIVQATLPLAEALHLLKSARASAITSRSVLLMEETIRELEELLREER